MRSSPSLPQRRQRVAAQLSQRCRAAATLRSEAPWGWIGLLARVTCTEANAHRHVRLVARGLPRQSAVALAHGPLGALVEVCALVRAVWIDLQKERRVSKPCTCAPSSRGLLPLCKLLAGVAYAYTRGPLFGRMGGQNSLEHCPSRWTRIRYITRYSHCWGRQGRVTPVPNFHWFLPAFPVFLQAVPQHLWEYDGNFLGACHAPLACWWGRCTCSLHTQHTLQ